MSQLWSLLLLGVLLIVGQAVETQTPTCTDDSNAQSLQDCMVKMEHQTSMHVSRIVFYCQAMQTLDTAAGTVSENPVLRYKLEDALALLDIARWQHSPQLRRWPHTLWADSLFSSIVKRYFRQAQLHGHLEEALAHRRRIFSDHRLYYSDAGEEWKSARNSACIAPVSEVSAWESTAPTHRP